MAAPTPLSRYVRVQRTVDKELAAVLRDAADEAERMILALGKRKDAGAVIRRSQLSATLKQLRKLQSELWGSVTKATEMGMLRAAEAAADAEIAINRVLFEAAGVIHGDFDAAMRIQAQEGVANVIARGANGIPLSSQVYRSQALSRKLVDKAINRALLLGFSAKELAATVKGLINPNVAGGVSYASMRLARTEINNAFHRSQIDLRQGDPWTTGFRWHLSGSHPRPDECNDYADRSHFRGGDPGVFKTGDVPGKPHPQCLCWLETVTMDTEDFINAMASGRFDSFMDSKIETYGV
jgi:hypothetical protein